MLSDSRGPFKKAAQHLFRHLSDPRALRNNLIVQRFFTDPVTSSDGIADPLQRIRLLVREGAEACRQADIAAGAEKRASYQYAIATQSFLEDRPVEEVAASLRLSRRQYYRERAEIASRIAEYIHSYGRSPRNAIESLLDEARVDTARAEVRFHLGDHEEAIRILRRVAISDASPEVRLSAMLHMVLISLNRRDATLAEKTHADACSIISERPARSALSEAYVDFMAMQLAWYTDRIAMASDLAAQSVARLAPLQATASEPAKELYIRSLLERGTLQWICGNLGGSMMDLSDAQRALRQTHVSHFVLIDVAILIARLRGRLAGDSTHWRPADERLRELTELYERASVSGSAVVTMDALHALLEYHSYAGDDDATLKTARFAITVAERAQPATTSCPYCSVSVELLQTRHWREAGAMLRRCESASHVAPLLGETKWAKALYYLRSGAYAQALSIASAREGAYLPSILTRMHTVAAGAADALGRRREAADFAESAVSLAEAVGAAPSLRDAYRVAAKVTHDNRFRRTARELDKVLIA